MRAKSVNEKFTDKSDPVSDIGIGGIELVKEYRSIKHEAAEKWIKFLKDNLEGHVVKGSMMKWEDGHNWRPFEIFVKKVVNTVKRDGFTHEVTIKDSNDKNYTVNGENKIYIIE
jgi:uncharacterized surface protein with fasciclin (FAS1) repeats